MRKKFKFLKSCMIVLVYTCMTLSATLEAQNTTDFEIRMHAYTESYIKKNIANFSKEAILSENGESMTAEDIKLLCAEEGKSLFIKENMKEYLNLYFPPSAMVAGVDTLVCDNGGFEDGFQFYKGYISQHNSFQWGHGSSSCTPLTISGQNVTFLPVYPPVTKRLEIVSSGIDPLTGIQQTRFGEKALRINNQYGHITNCEGDFGIDRITKRFKVTEETKNFTVWYAVVLENPDDHEDQQPFLSIKCDKASEDDLCFDASFLKCVNEYPEDPCYYRNIKFNKVKGQDWTCHTFTISDEFVDSIATLEITVADCARKGHVGYAYIDGMCEPCDSCCSLIKLKTIDYISCYEEEVVPVATVCGEFSLNPPKVICNDVTFEQYKLIGINVPGYTIENLQIYNNNTFCFDFPVSNFTTEDCLEIFVEGYFLDGTDTLPVPLSNSLKICRSLYEVVDCTGGGGSAVDTCGIVLDVKVGGCNDNSTTPNISDDYYYVYVSLYDPDTIGWRLDRDLIDPYPNENSIHTLTSSEGDTINLILGPFLIQEGDWWLEAYLPECNFSYHIEAPDYCSGCDEFTDAEIGDVTCDPNNPLHWYFTIKVPNENPPTPNEFQLKLGTNNYGSYPYNTINTIGPLSFDFIYGSCLVFTLIKKNVTVPCESKFTICSPKPCIDICRLEVDVQDVECIFDPRSQTYSGHLVHLDISGMDANTQKACVSYTTPAYPNNKIQLGSYNNGIYVLGPFNEDIYLTVKICDKNVNCSNCNSVCFKTIYIPKPDCERQKEIEGGLELREIENKEFFEKPNSSGELLVIPNPFSDDEIILHSELKQTVYEIFDLSGKFIQKGEFNGIEQKIKLNVPKGTYFIRYIDNLGEPVFVKMIKL
ncbi:MAG: T9SS type A sorting domain-containing protein [Saprospiraceae bacterium]|nr:T9SS type A sorting domain-containing protein [Saprospiraceae bacterium]